MTKQTKQSLHWMQVLLALLLVFAVSVPATALEVKVFAIGDFVPTGSGGCGGGDRSHWPHMVGHWYNHMGVHGHMKDGQYTNGNMTIRRFCDPDWLPGCLDYLYADDADAVMIATHGSDNGDHWAGTMRYPWSGHCALDAGGTSDDMWLGDVDADFIHLSSCYSADDDNLFGIKEMMHDHSDNDIHAHQVDGFHGIMWIGSGYDNDYKEFAHDAHSVSISRSWVHNLYDSKVDCSWWDPFDWFGTCDEQCPVAYSVSTSGPSALTRLLNERYNYLYSHPTGCSGWAWRYIPHCDPVGETAWQNP